MAENRNMPSTTQVAGQLALRPCFVGARSVMAQAHELVDDVLRLGRALTTGARGAPSSSQARERCGAGAPA